METWQGLWILMSLLSLISDFLSLGFHLFLRAKESDWVKTQFTFNSMLIFWCSVYGKMSYNKIDFAEKCTYRTF